MKKLYAFLCSILALSSCSVDSIIERPSENEEVSNEISSFNKQNKSDCFNVTPSMLSNYIRLVCRGKSVESIEPIIEDGDTLAYYIQYAKGKGWDLIASDTRVSPRISGALGGILSLDTSDSKLYILSTFKNIRESLGDCEEHPVWLFLKNSSIVKTKSPSKVKDRVRGLAQGMWIPRDTVFILDTTCSNRLIPTKWGQREPWCWFTPFEPQIPIELNLHCDVGCVPVAVGQMIYKYMSSSNYPFAIPDSVSFIGKIPYFESFTYGWSGLALEDSCTDITAKKKTAKLLSWLGNQMGTTYNGYNGDSPTEEANMFSYLQYYFDFDTCSTLSPSTVMSNISSNKPVLVAAKSTTNKKHAFIIDGYKIIAYQVVIYYVFDPYHYVTDEEFYSLPSWVFEWPSMGQFPDYDPDKEPAVMPIATDLATSVYWKINWGNNGDGDDDDYPTLPTWNVGLSHYNTVTRVYYNFALL